MRKIVKGAVVYGSYIDEPLMMKAGGSKYYFAINHLYSVAALTDSTGAVVERYKYDAYGQQGILNSSGNVSYNPSDFGNFIGFTGRYHDWETGLVYFRARYYDTGLGRFIGRDPLGYVNGMGLYGAYFIPNSEDPTGMIDPVGHHFVPTAVQDELGFSEEAKLLFDATTTGPIPTGHFWDKPHSEYNKAVRELSQKWMQEKCIEASKMTRKQAEALSKFIIENPDTRIKSYLDAIKELQLADESVARQALQELKNKGLKRTTTNLLTLTRSIASKLALPITLALIAHDLASGQDATSIAKNAIIPADLIEDITTSVSNAIGEGIENSFLGASFKSEVSQWQEVIDLYNENN